jgi:MoxR-like ATPase
MAVYHRITFLYFEFSCLTGDLLVIPNTQNLSTALPLFGNRLFHNSIYLSSKEFNDDHAEIIKELAKKFRNLDFHSTKSFTKNALQALAQLSRNTPKGVARLGALDSISLDDVSVVRSWNFAVEFTDWDTNSKIYKEMTKWNKNLRLRVIPNASQVSDTPKENQENADTGLHASFEKVLKQKRIQMDPSLVNRFLAAVFSKPFVILVGPTGCGKTALAEVFARCITTKKMCARIAVAPNWTGPHHLLGYSSELAENGYHMTETAQLLKSAHENDTQAHVLILDEMNLSNVDQYFSPYMSALESSEKTLHFHESKEAEKVIPKSFKLPSNLFVIGTCNMDHAGHNLSPKVLDRAHVIEISTPANKLVHIIDQDTDDEVPEDDEDEGEDEEEDEQGPYHKWHEIKQVREPSIPQTTKDLIKELIKIERLGIEVRAIKEIKKYVKTRLWLQKDQAESLGLESLDEAILQKVLPKFNGGRELKSVLEELQRFTQRKTMSLSNSKLKDMLKSLETKPFVSFFKRV